MVDLPVRAPKTADGYCGDAVRVLQPEEAVLSCLAIELAVTHGLRTDHAERSPDRVEGFQADLVEAARRSRGSNVGPDDPRVGRQPTKRHLVEGERQALSRPPGVEGVARSSAAVDDAIVPIHGVPEPRGPDHSAGGGGNAGGIEHAVLEILEEEVGLLEREDSAVRDQEGTVDCTEIRNGINGQRLWRELGIHCDVHLADPGTSGLPAYHGAQGEGFPMGCVRRDPAGICLVSTDEDTDRRRGTELSPLVDQGTETGIRGRDQEPDVAAGARKDGIGTAVETDFVHEEPDVVEGRAAAAPG